MKQHSEYKFLGRVLGTATGWDGDVSEIWWLYDFIPATGVNLPVCDCLNINELTGTFDITDDSGNMTQTFDMIEILQSVPKS